MNDYAECLFQIHNNHLKHVVAYENLTAET